MRKITAEKLKEEGEYLGFSDSLGYVYKLGDRLYSYNRNGITDITHLEIAF